LGIDEAWELPSPIDFHVREQWCGTQSQDMAVVAAQLTLERIVRYFLLQDALQTTLKTRPMTSTDSNLATPPIPRRPLGRTGQSVTIFGLGGEGILRTHGRETEAVAVIQRALQQGVNYFETAPAYASSMDYYGLTLGEHRPAIFLASKTHDRTYDGSLRLLDDSLRRLHTDYLDLWQLHDLRSEDDLARIFGKGGAMKALLQARTEGRARYLGITGHHDPAILLAAMQEFEFDTVLVALNAADVHRMPFCETVLPEAARRNMGIIGMKSTAQGVLLKNGTLTMEEAMGYVLSLPGVSTLIIGCKTPAEVDENAHLARQFAAFTAEQLQELEGRTRPNADEFSYFKRPASISFRR
jgi:aryl-alcohol dehydrogenase-like predicted oxidoreductase